MTHSEKQIWLGQRMHPDSPLYNMAFAWVFPAELRLDLLAAAWQATVDENPALRATFPDRHGEPQKTILAPGCAPAAKHDWSDRPDAERAFRQWTHRRAAEPLALDAPLADCAFFRLGPNRTGWYLNQHHLIADARSTVLVHQQVARRYEALVRHESVTPRAPLSEKDKTYNAAEQEAAQAHWKAKRANNDRAVPLYVRHGSPAGTVGERRTLTLDAETSRAIEAVCNQPGFACLSPVMSRFTFFATALASWLQRVSGQQEIAFDTPVAGRTTAEAKRTMGLFIEMFPFDVSVNPLASYRSLAAQCMAETAQLLRHALPGLSAPSSASSGNVVLNYYPESFGDFAGVRGDVEWVHSGHCDSVHALRLQVHDFSGTGCVVFHFDFNASAFPAPLRERAIRHFEANLRALLANPDQKIGQVDLRGADEREQALRFTNTAALPTPVRTIVEQVWDLSKNEPDAEAVREEDRTLTRGELIRRADSLAARLLDAGVEPGDRVAILSKRSIEAVVAILATLRARAAYVPVDPSYPARRIQTILRDSGARIALAHEHQAPSHIQTLAIAGEPAALPADHPFPALTDLAYILYTSGSTGTPKGVQIEHAGLADYLEWASRQYVRGDRLRFPLFTSLSFDLTVTSLFLPLFTGGTLHVYPEPDGHADTTLQDVLRDNAVDFLKATPSHLSLLTRLGMEGSRIRRVVVGGEDFKTALAEQLASQLGPDAEIYNEYGPTEAVVGCVLHRFRPSVDRDVSVPIGLPADHVQADVLNQALAPVPHGAPGELWIARHGLARGYHHLPALSADRFQPHPADPFQRRYRTGDRVRVNQEGILEFLGRSDRQLKVSGHRVEPAEIETVLLHTEGVSECAVVARRRRASTQADVTCVHCGLPANYPGATFDQDGVCHVCRSYDAVKQHAAGYFKSMDDLGAAFRSAPRRGRYDCMMLLSGGKDSTYALCKLVEMGLSVYAFTLDNGYISEGAKANIRRVTSELGVPIELAQTPAMNAIFRDSLERHANVCQGCFKTLYTLSVNRALELDIPTIVTGLSRGQMFETRLTEEMFRDGARGPAEVDAAVLAARKVYHQVDDEVRRSLDVRAFDDDAVFERIQFVDFYRYCNVGLTEMLGYLREKVPWVRPEDTGRSTNCLINDVGIFVHKRQRGFHNYALPYSWDVRMGHKQRDQALEELDDHIDEAFVRKTLGEIGCDAESLMEPPGESVIAAFYVGDADLSPEVLRERLAERLPLPLIPTHFERVDAIPLTAHGKVDEAALPQLERIRSGKPYRAPDGPVAEFLADLWTQALNVDRVGADDDFFALGGTSLAAMDVMIRLCREFQIELPLDAAFQRPTLADLAGLAEDRILADVGLDDLDLDSASSAG